VKIVTGYLVQTLNDGEVRRDLGASVAKSLESAQELAQDLVDEDDEDVSLEWSEAEGFAHTWESNVFAGVGSYLITQVSVELED
jgi:hypothetical protein